MQRNNPVFILKIDLGHIGVAEVEHFYPLTGTAPD